MSTFQAQQNGTRVGLVLDGRPVGDLAWDEAVELGHVLFRRGYDLEQDPAHHSMWQVGRRRVCFAEGRCDVLYDGGLVASIEVPVARSIGKALIGVARQAEEWAKAEEVAADAAVLMRAGLHVGLAHHPAVRKEALKEALHNRDLRRAMPNRVSERSVVGTPRVSQEKR